MHSDPDKDIKLWKDFLNGSKTALSKIYLTYVKHLYAFGCKFTADKSLVKDCIQELFVTLMRSRSKLSATDNVKAYLFVALKRSILRELHRSTRFEKLIERGDYRFELAYDDFGRTQLEDDAISKKRMAVRAAVTTLTSRQKEALYLRFYVGLGHKEIAKILHLEEQSSRSLISRALKKVRNVIESDKNRISSFSFFSLLYSAPVWQ